jgi:hypothetical protein
VRQNSRDAVRFRLARVDGFDQDKAESKRDERAIILRRLLTSECDTLEALELAERLFDACPRLVIDIQKRIWHDRGSTLMTGQVPVKHWHKIIIGDQRSPMPSSTGSCTTLVGSRSRARAFEKLPLTMMSLTTSPATELIVTPTRERAWQGVNHRIPVPLQSVQLAAFARNPVEFVGMRTVHLKHLLSQI